MTVQLLNCTTEISDNNRMGWHSGKWEKSDVESVKLQNEDKLFNCRKVG